MSPGCLELPKMRYTISFFSALLVYVILKFIHTSVSKKIKQEPLSLLGFTRRLLQGHLPLEWQAFIQQFSRTLVFMPFLDIIS